MLPPDRFFIGVSRLGVFTLNLLTSWRACASIAAKFRKMPRVNSGAAWSRRKRFSSHGKFADRAVAHALFRHVGQARLRCAAAAKPASISCPSISHRALRHLAQARQALRQFALAVARHARPGPQSRRRARPGPRRAAPPCRDRPSRACRSICSRTSPALSGCGASGLISRPTIICASSLRVTPLRRARVHRAARRAAPSPGR